MEAQPLNDEARPVGFEDEIHRLPGCRAELRRELDHGAGVGHFQAQRESRVRRVFPDLPDLLGVVVRDERLVGVELPQRAVRLDRVGVDDLVPDPVLPFLRRQVLDVFIHDPKFGHGGHVEARARIEQGLHDGGIRQGFDRVVGLDAGQILPEGGVVPAQDFMVHHEERRPVLLCQFLQSPERGHSRLLPGQGGRLARSHAATTFFRGRRDGAAECATGSPGRAVGHPRRERSRAAAPGLPGRRSAIRDRRYRWV